MGIILTMPPMQGIFDDGTNATPFHLSVHQCHKIQMHVIISQGSLVPEAQGEDYISMTLSTIMFVYIFM